MGENFERSSLSNIEWMSVAQLAEHTQRAEHTQQAELERTRGCKHEDFSE